MKLPVLFYDDTSTDSASVELLWCIRILSSLLLVLLEVYCPQGLSVDLVNIQDYHLIKQLLPVLALGVCPLLVLDGCL